MCPFEEELSLLETIPGVGRRTAEVLVAEVGADMTLFPTSKHLASWAGICPGNNQSASKHKGGKASRGSLWLKSALVEAAQAASHTNTYLSAQYHRITARRGKKKAVVAVAHRILVIVYHLLKHNLPYKDLGRHYFDERQRQALEKRLVHRLQDIGYKVTLDPVALAR